MGTPRKRNPESTILLNIYDVIEHPFNYQLAKILTLGIHHTGIQIGMREFAFTLEGIVVTEPHRIPRCKLTHRVLLTSKATDELVKTALRNLQRRFTPQTYDPLNCNCNTFSDAFCQLLGNFRVPAWVNRAPTMASMLGTRFRLRPARVTAPAIAWGLLLVDGPTPTTSSPKKKTTQKPRATSTESLEDDDEEEVSARAPRPPPREPAVHPEQTVVAREKVKPIPHPTPVWTAYLSEIPAESSQQQQKSNNGDVVTPGGIGKLWNESTLVDSSRITAFDNGASSDGGSQKSGKRSSDPSINAKMQYPSRSITR